MREKPTPLSDRAVNWLKEFKTPGEAFLRQHIASPYRKGITAEEVASLLPHCPAIAVIINTRVNAALNHDAESRDDWMSYRELNRRLREVAPKLIEDMREEIPELNDAQTALVVDVYHGWRARIGHNIGSQGASR